MARKQAVADPASFVIEDDDEPLPSVTRGGRLASMPNPYTDALWNSYEQGKPKRVVVPGGDPLRDAYALIRRAADDQNIGARIVVQNDQGELVRNLSKGKGEAKVILDDSLTLAFKGEYPSNTFTLRFQGMDRKQYATRSNGESVEDSE